MPKIYVILLNWNGWRDTIECVASLLHSDYRNFQIVICDNDSKDGSYERIKSWALGKAEGQFKSNIDSSEGYQDIQLPIKLQEVCAGEFGQNSQNEKEAKLILIQNGKNMGFAGGNNIGLRYALERDDFEYVWILNNDTVVDPDAMSELVSFLKARPNVGICGAKLMHYDEPNRIQATGGGRYTVWTGKGKTLSGEIEAPPEIAINSKEIVELYYVSGASMMISKAFLNEVGLLSEDYFLYFEELDWVMRASAQMHLGYQPKAMVYHKEGASIGTGKQGRMPSPTSEFYFFRSRLIFTRKYFLRYFPLIYVFSCFYVFKRIVQGELENAYAICMALLGCKHLKKVVYKNC